MRGERGKKPNIWHMWELQAHQEANNGCFIHCGIMYISEEYHVYIEVENGNANHMDTDGKTFKRLIDAVLFANNRIEELIHTP